MEEKSGIEVVPETENFPIHEVETSNEIEITMEEFDISDDTKSIGIWTPQEPPSVFALDTAQNFTDSDFESHSVKDFCDLICVEDDEPDRQICIICQKYEDLKDESVVLEELKKLIGDENYVEVEVETLEHVRGEIMRTDFEIEMLIVGNKSLSNKHESSPHQSVKEHPTAVSNISQTNLSANGEKHKLPITDNASQGQTDDNNPALSQFNLDREDASDITAESSKLFETSIPKNIALPEYKNFEEQNPPSNQNIKNLSSETKSETGAKMGILPKIDIAAVKDILNEIPTSPRDEILNLISEKMAADIHPTDRKSFTDGLFNALSALWSG
jgi:hypothetical protein